MAPPSTAGTHPSDTSEGCGVLPVLTHTISSGPPEHHLPIPSLLHRYISTIRDDRRGLFDALLHFLRFLRFLRNGLGVKTLDGSRWLDPVKVAHGQSKSSSRLPSLCST